jgi:hypothetical protein
VVHVPRRSRRRTRGPDRSEPRACRAPPACFGRSNLRAPLQLRHNLIRDAEGNLERSTNLQWYLAAQYLFYRQLYVKVVGGYAKSHFENKATSPRTMTTSSAFASAFGAFSKPISIVALMGPNCTVLALV